jgi:hypothetical protein
VEQATDGTKEKAINHPPWQKITRKQTEFPFPQQTEKNCRIDRPSRKTKKQANAKFNNGNFTALRTLYTLGIQSMAKSEHRLGPKEAEMLSNMHSNMHSNRAVTFFGANNFNSCRRGCEVAIQYNPYYEKSWIRKWRALMALGSAAATQAQAAAAAQYPTTTTTTKNETKPTTTTSTDDNRDQNTSKCGETD